MRTPRPLKPALPPEDDPTTIIALRRGVIDITVIDDVVAAAAKVNAGPVRLLQGVQTNKGGWGLRHLTAVPDRVRAITGLGYATCEAFVLDVSDNWTEVHEVSEPGRVKLVYPKDGLELALVIEWTGKIWSVTTALPFRAKGSTKLYVRTV